MSRQNSKVSASGNPTTTELVNLNEVEPIRSTCGGLYRNALGAAVDGVLDRNFRVWAQRASRMVWRFIWVRAGRL